MDVLLVMDGEVATTQIIEQLLRVCQRFGVSYRKAEVPALRFSDFRPRTIPLLVRCAHPKLRPWIKMLRHAGHPYIYYIDDNLWDLRGDSSVAKHYRIPEVRRSLDSAVADARLVLTNSPVLAAFVKTFNSRVVVLSPFFDFRVIEGCQRVPTNELRIGFAGNYTRADDLDLIRPIIGPVLDSMPNAVFEFAGVLPHGIRPEPRIRFFEYINSYQDFVRFQVERNWAIGLAPLQDHAANRAKTNNKYREYGACGIAGIYSDMPPYCDCVIPGITGLLVDSSPESWFRAIQDLAAPFGLREKIAKTAEQDIRMRFSLDTVASEWRDCFAEIQVELTERRTHGAWGWLTSVLPAVTASKAAIVRAQVQDAYQIGGVTMILKRTVKRLSSALAK
jgi:glycosyltransferase involved in cell wall biosynthesis